MAEELYSTPTIKVTIKGHDGPININEDEFNEEVHTKYVEKPGAKTVVKPVEAPKPDGWGDPETKAN